MRLFSVKNTYKDRPARPGGRRDIAWRTFSLILAMSLLFNSIGLAAPSAARPVALRAESAVGTDDVDYRVVEQETELGGASASDSGAGLENLCYYAFDGEASALLSEIFAVNGLKIALKDVETVLIPGGDATKKSSEQLFVEPLTDENEKIYDYRITALLPFEEARLSVILPGATYTLVLSNQPTTPEPVDYSADYVAELGDDAETSDVGANDSAAYSLAGGASARLSEIIAACGMPFDAAQVEMVGLPGGEGEDAPVSVEKAGDDYVIAVMEPFAETRLAVYALDGVFTVRLLDGRPDVADVETALSEEPVAEEPEAELPSAPEAEIPVEESASEDEERTEVYNDEIEQTEVGYEETAPEAAETLDESGEEAPETVEEAVEEAPEEAPETAPETEPETEPEAEIDLGPEPEPAVEPETQPEAEPEAGEALPSDGIELTGESAYDGAYLRLAAADGAATLNETACEPADYLRIEEAYAIESGEGVRVELVREPELAEGEYLALYGIRDGALSESPLADHWIEGDGATVRTRDWDGFALARLGLTAYQQLPEESLGESTVALSGTLPVGATVSLDTVAALDAEDDVVASCGISIVDGADNAFEPLEGQPIEITLRSEGIRAAIEAGSALSVVMVAEGFETDAGVELISAEGDAVTFSVDSCDAFAVREIVLEKDQTVSDGSTYRITVGYDTASGIPADAALVVSEIAEADAKYAEYVEKSVESLGGAEDVIRYARAFDIALVNPETGEEYHSEKDVRVGIQLLDDSLVDYDSVDVVHIHGEDETVVEVMQTGLDGDTVEFAADSFSVYVLVYTVDFHWGDYTYSIEGAGEITLSELFEKLGVTEITVDDVTDVSFSDETLVRVERAGDDWVLTSLKPFDTEEALTLALANGAQVEIKVTDAQTTDTVCPYCDNNFNVSGWEEYTISANAIASGEANKVYWKIENGCLYIHCDADIQENKCLTGANYRWDYNTTPWVNNNDVVSAVVTGNMTRIFSQMFKGNSNLESVTFDCPNAISMDGGVFQDTGSNVKKDQPVNIVLSNCKKLKTINAQAFLNCYKNGFTVDFSGCEELTTIKKDAFSFSNRAYLKGIDFSGCVSLSNIEQGAFVDTWNIEFADFSNSGISSLANIYIHKDHLESLNLSGSNNITAVDLTNYNKLEELWLPTSIESLVLAGANKLKTIHYDGGKSEWAKKVAEWEAAGYKLPASVEEIIYGILGPKITITAGSASKVYDGTALTAAADAYTYSVEVTDDTLDGQLKSGHVLKDVTLTGSQTDVGSSNNVPSSAKIVDGEGNDYTEDYEIIYVPGTLTVTPRPVTVSVGGSKVYGDDDPTTGTVTGLVGEDTIAYTVAHAEGQTGEDVGEYGLIATGDTEQGNYTITYEPGTLTITPAPLTVKADDKTKTAGQPEPTFTATITGLKNGDDEGVIQYAFSREMAEEEGGELSGTYAITPYGAAEQGNYTVSYEPGTLTIEKLRITFKNGERTLRIARLEWGEPIGTAINSAAYKENYDFKGWCLENSTESVTAEDTFTADATLYARFTYTVTFEADTDAELSETERKVDEGAPVGTLPVPVKLGHRFVGWFDASGAQATEASVYAGHTTLTAQFVKQVTVTFVVEGEEKQPDPVTVDIDTEIGDRFPDDPVREKHEFRGWFTEDDQNNAVTADTLIHEDMTVYARLVRQVTLTFIADGETIDTKTVDANTPIGVDVIPDGSKENCTLVGWYTGAGEQVTSDSTFDEDTTIKAKYTVTVTFRVWNADFTTATSTTPVVLDKGAAIGDKLLGEPVLAGYEFNGWFIADADGKPGDTETQVTADTVFNADTNVVAKFTRQVTIVFEYYENNNSEKAIIRQTFTVNAGEPVDLIENPIQTGSRFDGWFEGEVRRSNDKGLTDAEGNLVDANGNPTTTPVRNIVANEDMVLTARFVEQIKVSFVIVHPVNTTTVTLPESPEETLEIPAIDNHGSFTMDRKLPDGQSIGDEDFPDPPILSGYEFQNWYRVKAYGDGKSYDQLTEEEIKANGVFLLNKDISKPYVLDKDNPVDSSTAFTESTDVVAKFAQKVNIIFQYDKTEAGSTQAVTETVEAVVGTALSEYIPEAAKDGYRIVWYKDDRTVDTNDSVTAEDDNKVFTARYTKLATLTFMVGEDEYATRTIDEGTKVPSSDWPADPANQGTAHFIGWYDASGKTYNAETVVTSDVTLTAKFGYTVTFKAQKDTLEDVSTREVEAGQALGWLPAAPFWAGHSFVEWRVGNTAIDAGYTVEDDVTITAIYDGIDIYTITVNYKIGDVITDSKTITVSRSAVTADSPATVESPASFKKEEATYYPVMQQIRVTAVGKNTCEIQDKHEDVTVSYGENNSIVIDLPYKEANATYTVRYMLLKLGGSESNYATDYAQIEEEKDVPGVIGATVTPTVKEYDYAEKPKADPVKITETSGQVLYVYYTRKNFTLTYNANGGTLTNYTVTEPYGTQITLSTPTRQGYTFGGWYTDEALTKSAGNEGSNYTLKTDVTLFAKWTATRVDYTILYMKEVYDNTTKKTSYVFEKSDSGTAAVGTTVYAASAPAIILNGYEKLAAINGTTSQAGTGEDTAVTVSADGSATLKVYYSLIRYTLIFNINNNNGRITINGQTYTGSDYKIENVVLGQDISSMWPAGSSEIYSTATTGNRYFRYWTGAGNYVTKRSELIWDNVSNANSNHVMTYTASWTSSSYNRNAQYWLQQSDGKYKVEDAYTQIGLNTDNLSAKDIDGYSKHSDTPAGYPASGNVITAVTQSNSGNYVRDDNKTGGTNRTYYEFEDHFYRERRNNDNNSLTRYNVTFTYTYNFYYDRAQYSIEYYYGNTKLTTKSNIYFEADISGTAYNYTPNRPNNVDEDYTWGGWCSDSKLQNGYTFDKMPGSNLILYAKWVAPKYGVSFYLNHDSAATEEDAYLTISDVTKGDRLDKYLTDETRGKIESPKAPDNYTFEGWYTARVGGTSFDPFGSSVTEETKLYAHWTPTVITKYTVKYLDADDQTKNLLDPVTRYGRWKLNDEVSETAPYITDYNESEDDEETLIADAGTKTLKLQYDETQNVIVFHYSKKPENIKYTVNYVLYEDPSVKVADSKTETVSGSHTSVTETAAEPTVADYLDYRPTELTKTLELGSDAAKNVLTFYYTKGAKITASWLDMEGDEIKDSIVTYQDVGAAWKLDTALSGYTLDHVEKGGEATEDRSFTPESDTDSIEIKAYYKYNLSITAKSLSKTYDGDVLKLESDPTSVGVTGLKDGHTLEGITITGSLTDAGISDSTPSEAKISGLKDGVSAEDFYNITYVPGTLSVTKVNVVISLEPDRWTGNVYDGKVKLTGFTNGGKHIDEYIIISNDAFKEKYLDDIWKALLEKLLEEHQGEYQAAPGALLGEGDSKADGLAVMTDKKDAGDYYVEASVFESALDNVLGELDFDKNYNIIHYVRESRLEIQPLALHIETEGGEKGYDGRELTKEALTVTVGDGTKLTPSAEGVYTLVDGDEVTIQTSGSQTRPGTSRNTYTIDWGEVNADNYAVTEDLGELSVTERALIIEAQNTVMAYGASQPDIAVKVYLATAGEDGKLVKGEPISATLTHWSGSSYTLKLNAEGYTDNLPLTITFTDETGADVEDISKAEPGTYGIHPDWDAEAEKNYEIEFVEATLVIGIARVSNDGGASWKYFGYLVNDEDPAKGAFNYADGLTGNVIVQTMCETHGRFTLTDMFTFTKAQGDLTLTTMPGVSRSTIRPESLVWTGSGDMTVENMVLDGDKKTGMLSLIQVDGGALVVGEGAVLQNAEATEGGAIHAAMSTDVTVKSGAQIVSCSADKGGAIYSAGTVTVEGGTMTNNTAKDGGAIYSTGALTVSGGTISENMVDNGGAIYSTGTLSVTGGTITGNGAQSGGAVYATGTVTLEGGVIENNKATENGGAVYGASGSEITVKGGRIISNSAQNGGAVYASGKLEMKDGTLSANTARNDGGAVYVNGGEGMTLSGGSLTGNIAQNEGGAVYVNGATMTMTGGTIDGGKPEGGNAVDGGGVYVNGGSLTVSGGVIENCVATNDGGGVYANGSLTIKGGEIRGNSAENDGGGVFLADRMTLTMTGGTVDGNMAKVGGGICARGNSANNNNPDRDNLEATVTVTISNVLFSGNTATTCGGGLLIGQGAVAKLKGVRMIDNKATGTTQDFDGTFMTWGSDYAYGCGGGLFADRLTTIRMSECTIGEKDHPNTAESTKFSDALREIVGGSGGGIFQYGHKDIQADWASSNIYMYDTTVQYNEALYGGGIGSAFKPTLEVSSVVTGSVISNNTASQRGGGILTRANAKIILTKVTVENNTADDQGGGFHTTMSEPERFVLDNCTVQGNTARLGGGGSASRITLKNTQIAGNWTTSHDGEGPLIDGAGGLYLTGQLVIDDRTGDDLTPTNIAGNYTSEIRRVPSDLHLPYNKEKKENNADSVILKSRFVGKLNVTNPGKVGSVFGVTDDLEYYDDIEDAAQWYKANIVSQNDSMFYGRENLNNDLNLYWYQEFICKITDSTGNLLYMKETKTDKEDGEERIYDVYNDAVYMFLFDATKNDDPGTTASAFGTLNQPIQLYSRATEENYTEYDGPVRVEMLVDYGINTPVRVNAQSSLYKDITLTTAVPRSTDIKYGYRDEGKTATLSPGSGLGVLNRNGQEAFMFRLQNGAKLRVENLTLDGGVEYIKDSAGNVSFKNGAPLYTPNSFISKKDGFLFQMTNASQLTLDDGATLQNAYTTHMWGGGAVCFGQSAYGATVTMEAGSKIYRCFSGNTPNSTSNDTGGIGGAIAIFNAPATGNNSIVIKGGTVEQCWAQQKGGAFYVASRVGRLVIDVDDGATFKMQDCLAPQGGGIYLDDRASGGDHTPDVTSSISLQGALNFSGNYGTDYADYMGMTNGGEYVYDSGKARQDIYVHSFTDSTDDSNHNRVVPASNITVTGAINAASGSIWVWCETNDPTHHKYAEQFAVLSDGMTEIQKARLNLEAFRNARPDVETDNYTENYLTGGLGDKVGKDLQINGKTCVYWGPIEDGSDVVLLKLNGFGEALDGAAFTLYYADADGGITDVVYQESAYLEPDDIVRIKVFIEGETGTTVESREIYGDGHGLVRFENVQAATYYLKETTLPKVDPTGEQTWQPVEETYKLVMDITGGYTLYVADDTAEDGWSPAPTTTFTEDSEGRYALNPETPKADEPGTANIFTVLNQSPEDRKVILKKVDGESLAALKGARFRLYRVDLSEITEGQPADEATGKPLGYYPSMDSGVFFIGRLPYGIYYMEETATSSEDYVKPTRYFRFRVDENGVSEPDETDWKPTRTLKAPDSDE